MICSFLRFLLLQLLWLMQTTINRKTLVWSNWIQSTYWWLKVKLKKTAASPQSSTNLWRKQICMSVLDTSHWSFANTSWESFRVNKQLYIKWNTHKSTINKIILQKQLEGYFIFKKAINWCEKFLTPNRHPCHALPQTCRGGKSICPVCIRLTENFLTLPRTSFGINEFWSDYWKQNNQQSMMLRWRLNLQIKYFTNNKL